MSYPIFIKRSSTLKPDNMFYFFDCGDLWVRKNVNLQDDIERCFDIILPSMSTLANNVIKYFGWAMKYTVPYLNQIKGLKLRGGFIKNKIDRVKIDQNSELIYYMYDEDLNLIGIDKAVASSIIIYFNDQSMDEIIFITNPEGILYPEEFLNKNETFLNGFINREKEKIYKKDILVD